MKFTVGYRDLKPIPRRYLKIYPVIEKTYLKIACNWFCIVICQKIDKNGSTGTRTIPRGSRRQKFKFCCDLEVTPRRYLKIYPVIEKNIQKQHVIGLNDLKGVQTNQKPLLIREICRKFCFRDIEAIPRGSQRQKLVFLSPIQ